MRPPEPPPPTLSFVVLAGDDLTPLTASLSVADEATETDDNGEATVIWDEEPVDVVAAASGFHDGTLTVTEQPLEGPIEIRLDPVVLNGTVTSEDGRPLPGSTVKLT